METEATKNSPILDIAWKRFAELDASSRRTKGFYRNIRKLDRLHLAFWQLFLPFFPCIPAQFFLI